MNLSLTVLNLAGAIALLLWGVRMVQTGVQRAFGPRLRQVLGAALSNRFSAFAAGLGATAVLQSSTATGLMITGFAASGLVDLVPALSMMLGANVGTTLIVQLFSFDAAAAAPMLILLGVLLFRRAAAAPRDFGRVLIGLGLMFMALRELLTIVTPYEDQPSLRLLLGIVATQPIVDVVIAAGLTWATHSSVVVVLLVMSLAARGVVPPDTAFALVLGANLGTAINPCLEGHAGGDAAARRLPIGNLLTRVIGVAVTLPALAPLGRMIVMWEPNAERAVADFHVAFNLAVAVVFMPLLPAFARLLRRMLPTQVAAADPARPLYLDSTALETPFLALGCATREALRLADVLEDMLNGFGAAIDGNDRRRIGETKKLAGILDKLNGAVTTYLTELDPEAMSVDDRHRASDIVLFASNLEHAADVVGRNLLGLAAKRIKQGLTLPQDHQAELRATLDQLLANLRSAASVFLTRDLRSARLLATQKEVFRDIESRAASEHFARLREGLVDRERGTLLLDLLRDMKRVNMHLVSAAAYPVLEQGGELLPTRLRHSLMAGGEDSDVET